MDKRLVGRNDPCPCGSGKKFKRCCMSKAYEGPGKEKTLHSRILREIQAFCDQYYRRKLSEAADTFWGDCTPEEDLPESLHETAEINFREWVVYDWMVDEEKGKRLIDLYIEKNNRLTPDEDMILNVMKDSLISLYEVQEVFPEKGLLLKDLVLGGEYDVKEKLATRELRKWDIFASRLLHLDGIYIISGCTYPYPRRRKDWMLDCIGKNLNDVNKRSKVKNKRVLLKEISEVFNYLWCDQILHPPEMNLSTTSGEPVVYSTAVFEVLDYDRVFQGLKYIKGFRQEGRNEYLWLDSPKEDSSTVLGNLSLKGKALTLECISKERLETGKRLLTTHLMKAISHRGDTFKEMSEIARNLDEVGRVKSKREIPTEIERKIYETEMRKYSEKWLEMEIPALDNKTPLEAIKTKKGREQVRELLKLIENTEEARKRDGEPFFDTTYLWKRLNIDPEE
ncbi:SEC-C domain-containing protein [candidate division WOR-3 bacterium]|nr:SEC-C domain-containing protein [candidate division WOR-3 bacterium]